MHGFPRLLFPYFIQRLFADLQAYNASHRDALWACRSAIFKHFSSFTFVLLVHFDGNTFVLLLEYILNSTLLLATEYIYIALLVLLLK